MAQPQFFFANPDTSFSKIASESIEAGKQYRGIKMQQGLNQAYNDNIATETKFDSNGNVVTRPGDLDQAGFIKSAQAQGLDPEPSLAYLDYYNKQKLAQSTVADTDTNLRAMGYNPQAEGRANAPIGNPNTPEAQHSPSSSAGVTTASPEQLEAAKRMDEYLSKKNPNGSPTEAPKAISEPTKESPTTVGLTKDELWAKLKGSDKATIKKVQADIGVKADGKAGTETKKALETWFNRAKGIHGSDAEFDISPVGLSSAAPKADQVDNGEVNGVGLSSAAPKADQVDNGEVNGVGLSSAAPKADQVDNGEVNGVVHLTPTSSTSSKGEEAKMVDVPMPDIFTPVKGLPDNRTSLQAVQDSYSPDTSMYGSGNGSEGEDSKFAWNPVNDGSNEYRQYASALASKLQAIGVSSASELLKKVYDATYSQNLASKPNEALKRMGKEGQIKYAQQVADYEASKVKARGLADQKVLEARQALVEDSNKFGVSTVDNRKLILQGGETLRDSSKRNEAASLKTNFDNIKKAKADLIEAGSNTTKLGLVAPSVFRVYATAVNPGMQLSEGNLAEAATKIFPEMSNKKEFIIKAVVGLGRGLRSGDWSMIDQLFNYVDASNPVAVSNRLRKMLNEASELNGVTYRSYVSGGTQDGGKSLDMLQGQGDAEGENTKSGAKKALDDAQKKAKAKKTGGAKKTETAAERHKRLFGN